MKVALSFDRRTCPRCDTNAPRCGDRYWNQFGRDCYWLSDDARGGFKCNKKWRDKEINGTHAGK